MMRWPSARWVAGACVWLLWLLGLLASGYVWSHALEPGYLSLTAASEVTEGTDSRYDVIWRRPDVNGRPMPIGVAFPADCQFDEPAPTFDGGAWLSRWSMTCQASLLGRSLRITGLERTQTDVLVRLETPSALLSERLTPVSTRLTLPSEPPTTAIFSTYLGLGFDHILEGWDHLLFVFALLMLIREPLRLLGAITAFTLAHSLTLALASLRIVALPGPPVEAIIALSIIFLATELAEKPSSKESLGRRYPWLITFIFGLLHGFGFAGALADIGIPQSDILGALFAFNVGVELGQIAFVAAVTGAGLLIAALWRAAGLLTVSRRSLEYLAAYPIGIMATFWLTERLVGMFG